MEATTLLRQPFERLVRNLVLCSPNPPLCLVSDFFLGWTLDICRHFGLPRVVFHGMSSFSMSIIKSLWNNLDSVPADRNEPFHIPGTPPTLLLTRDMINEVVLNSTDALNPVTRLLTQLEDADHNSWGVLVNSFSAVDGNYVRILESFYRQQGARAWLVGPLSLLAASVLGSSPPPVSDECLDWLNGKASGSVVYVSFGTQADVSGEQLEEVAYGLEESGYDYLWVVRTDTWSPPPTTTSTKRGKIARWAPQGEVLEHGSTGGFLSHCGWNSVMEGVSAGVPFLTWPLIAEQHLNAKHVVEQLGVGVMLKNTTARRIVRREEVRDGVRELMGGERGIKARKRVVLLRNKAKSAVGKGGSSRMTVEELIAALRSSRRDGVRELMGGERGIKARKR